VWELFAGDVAGTLVSWPIYTGQKIEKIFLSVQPISFFFIGLKGVSHEN